ncbi:hypothetical protein P170DRAFT_439905 [Aspergillus steynii IBT 23096]|uniref:Uncharacterized protein n=1 Tax=Aspergillus steynii IBT 23096 TaxID=1392250 RepID=A0A2I2G077_9EURO|nr:uncharacterized protein P170DRAFT_439905 [Aspergillus steynii IBT 23096]PLB46292.1 hypothetical protein P170DRAFT_439905 [Aspergillus steynii IBT 23096]
MECLVFVEDLQEISGESPGGSAIAQQPPGGKKHTRLKETLIDCDFSSPLQSLSRPPYSVDSVAMLVPVPELPERTEMRKALRDLINHVTNLQVDQISMFPSEIDQLRFECMALDEKSADRPSFFTPLPASLLRDPDDDFDREYEMKYQTFDSAPDDLRGPKSCAMRIDDYFSHYAGHCSYIIPKEDLVWSSVNFDIVAPYLNLHRYAHPEFGTTWVEEVRKGPYSQVKTTIYNNLNADDEHILEGELLSVLRLMMAHLRRGRFVDHMIAPVMAFSFMGPQHARVIEGYMEGHTVVVRPSKLYDLRTKDEAAFKTLAEWYFGKPRGPTLPS